MGRLADLYKSFVGHLEYSLGGWNYPADEMIVLCMHSTPADRMKEFERITELITKHFKPIHPSQLNAYFNGEMKEGPYVLFTFDDGLKNNLHVASYLANRGIGAYFFLVPDFISSTEPMTYYRKNIRQIIDASLDKLEEDFSCMNKEEVASLMHHGHMIGSHTMSHLLRASSSNADVVREVSESQKLLSSWFQMNVPAFCSVIQTTLSINARAKSEIQNQYTFHFTTYPGLNGTEKNPQLIFRRNIEVNWGSGKIKYALGKWDLRRWKAQIAAFRELR
ncbi:MAG: polysaccharide deacetylase family protein [Flavobacteriales bacterium]|nr:polysaccharide deacetylase family protein [Flavobacteriales bacterium]